MKNFRFRPNIAESTEQILKQQLNNSNITRSNETVLIGVHVRHNAFLLNHEQGYVPADVKYLATAIEVYNRADFVPI